MKKISEDCSLIDPSQGECYWYLGIAEIFLGEQESGTKHIEEAKQKGGFAPAYIQLGAALIKQKNYKGAAEAYRMLTAEYPNNASFHAIYALLSRELGDYATAANEAVKVFELQPDNNETEKFIIELLMLSPNDPSLYASLTFIYKKLGEEGKARQQLLKMESIYYDLFAKNPQSYGYLLNLARVHKELGKFEKAYQEVVLLKKSVYKTNPDGYDKYINEMLQSMPPEYWNKYLTFLEEFRLLNKNKK
ncbi:MAG: hypothetical protein HYT36_00130 [Candidatus Staskawiczbacteria bacterium]|nr:hypothetical protein [Candidatus Staskawiczbacteria bacterium]